MVNAQSSTSLHIALETIEAQEKEFLTQWNKLPDWYNANDPDISRKYEFIAGILKDINRRKIELLELLLKTHHGQ